MWRRAGIWLACGVLGVAASYLGAALRFPEAPFWLKATLGAVGAAVAIAIVEVLTVDQRRAYRALYQWDRERAAELLSSRQSRRIRELDPHSLAGLQVLLGQHESARALLHGSGPQLGALARLHRCIEAHAELAYEDTAGARDILRELLGFSRFGLLEMERYRLALIARAALLVTNHEQRRQAERYLRDHRDVEAHAFAQWLRACDSLPIDVAHDRVADAQRGAELAELHGHQVLAGKLEDRAAALGRTDVASPYRKN